MSEWAIISQLRVGVVSSIVEACGLGNRRNQQLGGLWHHHIVKNLWTGSLAGKNVEPARSDGLGGGPDRVILSMNVSHKLSDRLVRRELHSDFYPNARIRDLSSGAVADSVRPHVWGFCSLKDARPAPRAGGLGHWSLCFEDRGTT